MWVVFLLNTTQLRPWSSLGALEQRGGRKIDSSTSILVLKTILSLTREASFLRRIILVLAVSEILRYTHCTQTDRHPVNLI